MSVFANLSIKYKLWGLVLLSLVGISALTLHELQALRSGLMEEKKSQTRHIVDTAYGVITHFAAMADAGQLDKQEAQQRAIAQIKSLRYHGDNYFWINDYQPRMIMHPMKPELDGKDLSGAKDPNGKKLFVAFVDVVKKEKQGFVDYLWPKPGHDKPVAKTSYVKGYDKWQWVIGSGIYLDDVEKIYQTKLIMDLSIVVGLGLILIMVSYLIIRSVTIPLQRLQNTMHDVEMNGDLTQRSDIDQDDEVGAIAKAFDNMLSKFSEVIEEVKNLIDNLDGSSNTLTTVATQTARDVNQQQQKTDQIATAIHEMSATVQEVARSAETASNSANQAYEAAQNGNRVVGSTVSAINSLANEVISASEVISKLETDSEDIGRVLDVIRGIAEQTNLLALNAAIEAARAGEQGRGFAVVADEVRTLAQRTQESTQEIQAMIENLQAGAQQAGQVMQSGRQSAEGCTEQASEAGQSLQAIIQAVKEISEQNYQIASGAEEQSAVAEDINKNVTSISQIATQSASNSQQTVATCNSITEMIQRLDSTIRQFKAS